MVARGLRKQLCVLYAIQAWLFLERGSVSDYTTRSLAQIHPFDALETIYPKKDAIVRVVTVKLDEPPHDHHRDVNSFLSIKNQSGVKFIKSPSINTLCRLSQILSRIE